MATLSGSTLCGAATSCMGLGLRAGGRGGPFVQAIFRRMGEDKALKGASPGEMCTAIKAMAVLGGKNESALEMLEVELCIAKALNSLTPGDVCTLLSGLHEMFERRSYLLVRISQRIMDRGFIPLLRLEHVSCIAAAFSGLGHRDEPLFEAMQAHLLVSPAALGSSRANAESLLKSYNRFGLGSVKLGRALAPLVAADAGTGEGDAATGAGTVTGAGEGDAAMGAGTGEGDAAMGAGTGEGAEDLKDGRMQLEDGDAVGDEL